MKSTETAQEETIEQASVQLQYGWTSLHQDIVEMLVLLTDLCKANTVNIADVNARIVPTHVIEAAEKMCTKYLGPNFKQQTPKENYGELKRADNDQ
jgi:hypothetical protein